jgi:thiamine biosynthesis lipoprotein
VAGEPPDEGWAIGIALDSAAQDEDLHQVVAIRRGGLASSSTEVRTWSMDGESMHHIIDPATGLPASSCWRLVSATGDTCVDANALSTAAIVWGTAGLPRLRSFRQPARLVSNADRVLTLGGWPEDLRP